ncbi:MAG: hypothetical protein RL417_2356, partial [Pseudomonadota bacterium]
DSDITVSSNFQTLYFIEYNARYCSNGGMKSKVVGPKS